MNASDYGICVGKRYQCTNYAHYHGPLIVENMAKFGGGFILVYWCAESPSRKKGRNSLEFFIEMIGATKLDGMKDLIAMAERE